MAQLVKYTLYLCPITKALTIATTLVSILEYDNQGLWKAFKFEQQKRKRGKKLDLSSEPDTGTIYSHQQKWLGAVVEIGLHCLLIDSGFQGLQSLYQNGGKLCRTLELSGNGGSL